ncbi:MAG: hypothetical protein AAFQ57_11505 [Cyanobacteria bacterium J06626_14]
MTPKIVRIEGVNTPPNVPKPPSSFIEVEIEESGAGLDERPNGSFMGDRLLRGNSRE